MRRSDPRLNRPRRIRQTGGADVSTGIVSAPVYLPGAEGGDAAGMSGSLLIAVSGDAGAGCYVQVSNSHVQYVEDGAAIWNTIQTTWEWETVDGVITFGADHNDQANLACIAGTFSAVRLVSWGGAVTMEVSV